MTPFPALLEQLRRHEDLTSEQASDVMGEIMEGRVPPAQIAGLLMALALKGERPAEMVGFARAMRARATTLPAPVDDVFDTCGTGGDGAHSFNVSTAAAIVLAGAGVRVAKHGNRAVSSRAGSADVFEALGVNLEASPAQVHRALLEAGIAFFFAPQWHPSMRHAGPTRRELGVRTAFNLLGPITNPAGARRQVVGVSRPEHTELVARTLEALGTERAWVVHGAGGLDELSTLGHTKVSEVREGTVNTFYLHPSDLGLARVPMTALAGGTAEENAAMVVRLLEGEPGPRRDVVLFNTAAALLVAGRATSLAEGITLAAESIDRGHAASALERMTQVSRACRAACSRPWWRPHGDRRTSANVRRPCTSSRRWPDTPAVPRSASGRHSRPLGSASSRSVNAGRLHAAYCERITIPSRSHGATLRPVRRRFPS